MSAQTVTSRDASGTSGRRTRTTTCQWCEALMFEVKGPPSGQWESFSTKDVPFRFLQAFGKANGFEIRRPRFGRRFCKPACKQRAYELRRHTNPDGTPNEPLIATDLVHEMSRRSRAGHRADGWLAQVRAGLERYDDE